MEILTNLTAKLQHKTCTFIDKGMNNDTATV